MSYFHLCPICVLLRRYINRWGHCSDESAKAFMKPFEAFLSFICREGRRLFGSSLSTVGCCCRLNGKNLQMFGVNLCIVSPLGAVLVHNLEGRGDSELCA